MDRPLDERERFVSEETGKFRDDTTTTRHYRIHSRTEALQIGPINDGGNSSRR